MGAMMGKKHQSGTLQTYGVTASNQTFLNLIPVTITLGFRWKLFVNPKSAVEITITNKIFGGN